MRVASENVDALIKASYVTTTKEQTAGKSQRFQVGISARMKHQVNHVWTRQGTSKPGWKEGFKRRIKHWVEEEDKGNDLWLCRT